MSLPDLSPVSRFRPHLRPLDLASDQDPPKSPSPHLSQDPTMMTPPLTPSSSFSSSHTPSTPSDPYLTFDFHSAPEPSTSRLVLLGNVPKSTTSEVLRQSLKQCGQIKGILVRFQPIHSFVIIAFYDSRDAARAKAYVPQISVQGATLSARLLSPVILRKVCVCLPACRYSSASKRASHVSCFHASRRCLAPMHSWTNVRPLCQFPSTRVLWARTNCVMSSPPLVTSSLSLPPTPYVLFFSLALPPLVPDRLIACYCFSATLQTTPTRDAPRHLSTKCTTCTSLGPAFAPNLSPPKSSPRILPQRVPLRSPAGSAHAA